MATKKVKSAGRFKERYGVKIRTLVSKIEKTSRARHECPKCTKNTLKRKAAGIWVCKNCDVKIAGGAYQPNTPSAKIIQQLRTGKFEDLKKQMLELEKQEKIQETPKDQTEDQTDVQKEMK